jgi:hypothetical protein
MAKIEKQTFVYNDLLVIVCLDTQRSYKKLIDIGNFNIKCSVQIFIENAHKIIKIQILLLKIRQLIFFQLLI